MGFQLGSRTSIDDRGRVTIPREIRRTLDLKKDQNLTVELRNKDSPEARAPNGGIHVATQGMCERFPTEAHRTQGDMGHYACS